MKNSIKNLLLLLLSYLVLMSFSYVSGLYGNKNYSSGLFCVIIYCLIAFIIIGYLKKGTSTRETVTMSFISFIVSGALVFGYNLETLDTLACTSIKTYIYILSLGTFLYSIINFCLVNKKKIYTQIGKLFKLDLFEKYILNKYTFIKCLVLIIIAWIPVFLAFYPGIFSYDAPYQFTDIYLWNFRSGNPVIHTLIIGGTLNLGKILFGSYNVGVAIYSLLQMSILASTLSYVVYYLSKQNANKYLIIIALLIFMFLPTHSLLAITTTKDVMFSCFVTIFFIKNIDLIFYKSELNKKSIGTLIFFTFLVLIFRPNGIYAYVFYIIFLILYYVIKERKSLKLLAVVIVVPLLLFKAYNWGISYLPRPKASSASFSPIYLMPIQQMGRVYNYENLSKREKRELDLLFNRKTECTLCFYNKYIYDPIGTKKDTATISRNIDKFQKYYIKYLFIYPDTYLDGFAYNSIAYWSIYDKYPENSYYYKYRPYLEMYTEDRDNHTNNEIKNETKFKFLYDKYISYIEDGRYKSIPILSLLLSAAIYNLLFICILMVLIINKKWKKIVPLMFLLGLLGINFLGPTSLVRYCYYFYICFPLIIHLAAMKETK